MHSHSQAFGNQAPTATAHLGRVGSPDGDQWNTSFFRFIFQHRPEQAKARIVRGLREMFISVHETKGKALDRNQVVLIHQPAAKIVQEVVSLIGHLVMHPSDSVVGGFLSCAALDLPAGMAL